MDICAENIQVSIGGTEILRDISITVPDKRFVGVIGPNGSGKSTLLKCIYRVLKPDAGMVQLGGESLSALGVKETARRMGVVAQHNFYNFDFTVEEVVLMGRAPHKRTLDRDTAEDYRIVSEALDTVGMGAFRERCFSTLSGGEQQRIILARALAQKTPCLILDEPTNHLDVKFQLQLLTIVRSLNLTVIAALHDLNLAAMYCDYLYVLKNGSVVARGEPEEVLTPELIRDVYEVDAELLRDRVDRLHIVYHPMQAASCGKEE